MEGSAPLGVESFFLRHPNNNEVIKSLKHEKQQREIAQGVGEKPLVVYLAQRMIDAGARGLKYSESEFPPESLKSRPRAQEYFNYTRLKESGGILWGAVVIALHDTFENGYCNLKALAGRVNTALGTQSVFLSEDEMKIKPLTPDELKSMGKAADTDRTFTIFYENTKLMPPNLRLFLERINALPAIGSIIPDWKATAEPLIQPAA